MPQCAAYGTGMTRTLQRIGLLIVALALTGCGAGATVSDVQLSDNTLDLTGQGETVNISYMVGELSDVRVLLQNTAGDTFALRDNATRLPSNEPYVLRFDGTAPVTDTANLLRRRLPNGTYDVLVVATERETGQRSELKATSQLTITGEISPPPIPENVVAFPETITPNADGIDDVTELTYQLPVSATVDISVSGPDCQPGAFCQSYPLVTASDEGPEPQRHVWNGRTIDGVTLPDGTYTYSLRATDRYGTLAEQTGTIVVQQTGTPEATLTYINIAPEQLALGNVLTVTMRVKNTGTVPIRTYGPASGYEYSTRDVFSSIEDGRYDAKSGGFWRVGVDWDANSGGARRYPFRWAISPRPPEQWKVPFEEDVLMPGEEALVTGRIRVDQQETKMTFYAGLIWDGVGFRQDRSGRTLVYVGF